MLICGLEEGGGGEMEERALKIFLSDTFLCGYWVVVGLLGMVGSLCFCVGLRLELSKLLCPDRKYY